MDASFAQSTWGVSGPRMLAGCGAACAAAVLATGQQRLRSDAVQGTVAAPAAGDVLIERDTSAVLQAAALDNASSSGGAGGGGRGSGCGGCGGSGG